MLSEFIGCLVCSPLRKAMMHMQLSRLCSAGACSLWLTVWTLSCTVPIFWYWIMDALWKRDLLKIWPEGAMGNLLKCGGNQASCHDDHRRISVLHSMTQAFGLMTWIPRLQSNTHHPANVASWLHCDSCSMLDGFLLAMSALWHRLHLCKAFRA